jgi:hypothetical protein
LSGVTHRGLPDVGLGLQPAQDVEAVPLVLVLEVVLPLLVVLDPEHLLTILADDDRSSPIL